MMCSSSPSNLLVGSMRRRQVNGNYKRGINSSSSYFLVIVILFITGRTLNDMHDYCFVSAQLQVPQPQPHRSYNSTTKSVRRLLLALDDEHQQQSPSRGDNEVESEEPSLEHSLSHVALAVPLYFHSGSYHVYVSVGSSDPPQRKLLIVDTGSHLAAFPCLPCHDCGTDHASGTNLFDPKQSTTFHYVKCGACVWDGQSQCNRDAAATSAAAASPFPSEGVCEYQQKYTEGSTWTAYEARDLVFVGTKSIEESRELHHQMAVPFVFGCEITETGLFRDQYADGILGMAMHPNSLLEAFFYHNRIANLAFGMCIDGNSIYQSYYAPNAAAGKRNNNKTKQREASYGGILTIGGADEQDLQQFVHHIQPMQFADLQYDSGWYTVHIKGVFLVSSDGKNVIPVETESRQTQNQNPFNLGKGTIVDSGTTDTFFPAPLAKKIQRAWEQAAHASVGLRRIRYSNDPIKLTSKEFRQLPTFHLVLQGDAFHSNDNVHWMIPPSSYMEQSKSSSKDQRAGGSMGTRGGAAGSDFLSLSQERLEWKGQRTFTNRIYLDETNGAVLGANAMMDHHILFDNGNHRLGIAPASCATFDDVYHDVVPNDHDK